MQDTKTNMPVLLDTHVIIWSLIAPEELSDSVKTTIESAQDDDRLLVSSISLWEIAMLKSKKRLNIYEPTREFLEDIANIEGLRVVDISPIIAAESVSLVDNFHGDPADRIIAATAITESACLFTRDNQILSWAKLGNIKAIKA